MVNSEIFFKTWLETISIEKENLLSIWRNAKLFTPYIKDSENSILRQIAEKLNLKCFPNEYYYIDAIFYLEEDLVPGRPEGSTWVRDIRIALEHENDFNSGLYKEVSHLLIINCDLKILITYYPQGNHEPQLEYLHSIISNSRQSKYLSDSESFLLIIGAEKGFIWDGHVFKEDGWKIINS
jgi:hypothetical protein